MFAKQMQHNLLCGPKNTDVSVRGEVRQLTLPGFLIGP